MKKYFKCKTGCFIIITNVFCILDRERAKENSEKLDKS